MRLVPTVVGIMTNDDMEALVAQLKALQVQKARLLDEERQIVDRLAQAASTRPREMYDLDTRSSGPLSSPTEAISVSFKTGDHVYITNRLGALTPLGRASLKDRAAIVTGWLGDRVYFKTLRGRESWRSPHNLRALTTREKSKLGLDSRE